MNDERRYEYDQDAFLRHLSKYIGKTVTIFTVGSSEHGLGFTGVLLSVTPYMVSLVTRVGPKPSSPFDFQNHYKDPNYKGKPITNIGSITDIPSDKISAFVHNAV